MLLGQTANEKTAKSTDANPQVVPITQEEHHHLVLENEYVRVFHVEVAPHSETKYHQHDMDYVFVTLGDSVVENDRVREKPVKLELKDGDTRFTKGGFAHKAVNLSDKPFVNVTVELKKKTENKFEGKLFDRCEGLACEKDILLASNLKCFELSKIPAYATSMGLPQSANRLVIMTTDSIDKHGKSLAIGEVRWETGGVTLQGQREKSPLKAVICEFAKPGEDFLKPAK
jgi:quercetin dioxygenase-like cupin family protein